MIGSQPILPEIRDFASKVYLKEGKGHQSEKKATETMAVNAYSSNKT